MIDATMRDNGFSCPCCRSPWRHDTAEYDICPHCGWEDEGGSGHPWSNGYTDGPNHMTPAAHRIALLAVINRQHTVRQGEKAVFALSLRTTPEERDALERRLNELVLAQGPRGPFLPAEIIGKRAAGEDDEDVLDRVFTAAHRAKLEWADTEDEILAKS